MNSKQRIIFNFDIQYSKSEREEENVRGRKGKFNL